MVLDDIIKEEASYVHEIRTAKTTRHLPMQLSTSGSTRSRPLPSSSSVTHPAASGSGMSGTLDMKNMCAGRCDESIGAADANNSSTQLSKDILQMLPAYGVLAITLSNKIKIALGKVQAHVQASWDLDFDALTVS
jgi:hypothetical protein